MLVHPVSLISRCGKWGIVFFSQLLYRNCKTIASVLLECVESGPTIVPIVCAVRLFRGFNIWAFNRQTFTEFRKPHHNGEYTSNLESLECLQKEVYDTVYYFKKRFKFNVCWVYFYVKIQNGDFKNDYECKKSYLFSKKLASIAKKIKN